MLFKWVKQKIFTVFIQQNKLLSKFYYIIVSLKSLEAALYSNLFHSLK